MEQGPVPNNKRGRQGKKKKAPANSDIVFSARNGSIQTLPSLQKHLTSVTETVVGLQYIWEYRSPSKSAPPHYQCKLCKVQRLQKEIVSHILGWKHCFRYLKHLHKDKVPYEEEEAGKDPSVRKAIKATAAEVENAEGRGQIKVVLREPCEVIAFQGMKSAQPRVGFPGNGGIHGPAPRGLQRDHFSDSQFMGHGGMGPMRRGPPDMGGFPGQGGYEDYMAIPDREMMQREDMQQFSDDMHMGADGFEIGQRCERMDRPFPDDDDAMNRGGDRIMGPGESIPSTLLKYLDNFRIENEDDAQIVLKVTQKLTDVLMDYRLRSISVPSLKPLSSSSFNYSSSRHSHGSNDRYSGGMPGSSRFYN
ncbi:uncharacterized protein si:ch211-197h24.6 [Triplophysa dalaica]|uniref:uncharacterized protein si:ch211-197h24.6 n=1 Tax=Triplophysa dalaica TaxID=1582913 RepID=UPI0024DF8BE4|nr:uncharacterized protein si:ch211-197h24.6 [Triplophysa dalaica]